MFNLDSNLLETYKTKIDEIIESVKVKKHITLRSIDETWVGVTILQNYLLEKCIENRLHIDKFSRQNDDYCVIHIDSL